MTSYDFPQASNQDGESWSIGTRKVASSMDGKHAGAGNESYESYESGSGTVESYTPNKTKDHDEIVIRTKDGRRIRISNNTKMGRLLKVVAGDRLNYHGYRVKGTNVVHKVHPNAHSRGGWLEEKAAESVMSKSASPFTRRLAQHLDMKITPNLLRAVFDKLPGNAVDRYIYPMFKGKTVRSLYRPLRKGRFGLVDQMPISVRTLSDDPRMKKILGPSMTTPEFLKENPYNGFTVYKGDIAKPFKPNSGKNDLIFSSGRPTVAHDYHFRPTGYNGIAGPTMLATGDVRRSPTYLSGERFFTPQTASVDLDRQINAVKSGRGTQRYYRTGYHDSSNIPDFEITLPRDEYASVLDKYYLVEPKPGTNTNVGFGHFAEKYFDPESFEQMPFTYRRILDPDKFQSIAKDVNVTNGHDKVLPFPRDTKDLGFFGNIGFLRRVGKDFRRGVGASIRDRGGLIRSLGRMRRNGIKSEINEIMAGVPAQLNQIAPLEDPQAKRLQELRHRLFEHVTNKVESIPGPIRQGLWFNWGRGSKRFGRSSSPALAWDDSPGMTLEQWRRVLSGIPRQGPTHWVRGQGYPFPASPPPGHGQGYGIFSGIPIGGNQWKTV